MVEKILVVVIGFVAGFGIGRLLSNIHFTNAKRRNGVDHNEY